MSGGDVVGMTMGGEAWEGRSFAHSLRVRIWSEHLGCAPSVVADPIDDDFYQNKWHKQATTNSMIFREVFDCLPDNTIHSISDMLEHAARHDSTGKSQGVKMQHLHATIEMLRNTTEDSLATMAEELQGRKREQTHLVQLTTHLYREVAGTFHTRACACTHACMHTRSQWHGRYSTASGFVRPNG